MLRLLGCALALSLGFAAARPCQAEAQTAVRPSRILPARIFVLMVWDGLRPDFVTAERTPNLFAMANGGVRFARQHSVYPTITMVDAAALATGTPPGTTAILGDEVSLARRLGAHKIALAPDDAWAKEPVNLENSAALAALNGPKFFNGALLGSESIGQQVRRAGGYLAIVGKRGPTFLFDDSVSGDAAPGGPIDAGKYIFVSDDLLAPPSLNGALAPAPPDAKSESVADGMRDTYFARVVTERALPEARDAALGGHPALVVFWQHNPDLTQHHRGLGTQPNLDALKLCDANLQSVRAAIARLGIADRTDLMVISDHGFATIRAMVPLAQMLIAKGLKQSATSRDITVMANGGTDLIDLSRAAFPTMESRRATLQKITDFIEAQPWAGPLFTRSADEERALDGAGKTYGKVTVGHSGWIDGTFSLDVVAMIGRENYFDAPDLVVSFRELPDVDNRGLTGPNAPVYVLDAKGASSGSTGKNRSDALVVPVKGVMYADAGGWGGFTTGLGMHAAAGARELHNFCAAVGPDFRRGFVDPYPSGNLDIRATIARAMGLPPGEQGAGRVLDEALSDRKFTGSTTESRITVGRTLPAPAAATVSTTLIFSQVSDGKRRWSYLDGAEYSQSGK
ncbi:MAG TPA: alkaline phosphatase family protein [Candidatus Binataceae bacterium]|nr:alkaline phosphatase family protein [Candidatus Binataceae bacterium]